MPPLITATAKVHSADENQVGANNGGGIYRWPEFDSRAGVSRLQPYPRLAHASYSLRKATTPKNPVPLEPNCVRTGTGCTLPLVACMCDVHVGGAAQEAAQLYNAHWARSGYEGMD